MFPDLFPLSGESLRNWLRTSGQNIFNLFDSGAATLEWMRSEGMVIRTSDFYEIRRQVGELQQQQEQFISYPTDNLVPLGWMNTEHGLNLNTNFLYRFNVIGSDPLTGDPLTRVFAVGSDRQLTPDQAAAELDGMIAGDGIYYEINAEGYELIGTLARPGIF